MICLDSDFIVDFLRQKQNAVSRLQSLKGETVVSTEISYFEVLYGIFDKNPVPENEMNLVQRFFDSITNISLDHPSAYKAAEIAVYLDGTGQTIGLSDTLIGGICLAHNCTILTKNLKHFSRIKGLKVETY